MYNPRGNIETDHTHAHGDTISKTGINPQEDKKDETTVTAPNASPPECCTATTGIQQNPSGAEGKQFNSACSISQFEKDSAKLLQSDTRAGTATIFDLRLEDRKRVGELINELASTSKNFAQLEANYEVCFREEARYREKSHNLTKKVDMLNEKFQKLEEEKLQMKDKHVASLKTLNNRVNQISDQFEASAKELKHHRQNNALVQNENKELREKIISVESKLATSEKTNQDLSENLIREKSRAHELEKKRKYEKRQRLKSENSKSAVLNRKYEENSSEDAQFDMKSGTKSSASEEEILHELFFRF